MSAPPLEDFLAPVKKELIMLSQIKQVIIKITLHQKVCLLQYCFIMNMTVFIFVVPVIIF